MTRKPAMVAAAAGVAAAGLTLAALPAQAYVGPSDGVERSMLTFDEVCQASGLPNCAADFEQYFPVGGGTVRPGGSTMQWYGFLWFRSKSQKTDVLIDVSPSTSKDHAAYRFSKLVPPADSTIVESSDSVVVFTSTFQDPDAGRHWGYRVLLVAGDALVQSECLSLPDWVQPPPATMSALETCARNTAAAQAAKWLKVSPQYSVALPVPKAPTLHALDNGQVRVEWAPQPAGQYDPTWTLELSGPDGEFPPYGYHVDGREVSVSPSQGHVTIEPQFAGTYRARLTASTPWGPGPLGEPSAPVTVYAQPAPAPPTNQPPWAGTPTFTSPRRGVLVARLSVTNGADVDYYQYRIKQVGKSRPTPWTKVTGSKVRLTGLKPGATYRFTIRAVGPAGTGPAGIVTTPPVHR